jgi:hypothetical protein
VRVVAALHELLLALQLLCVQLLSLQLMDGRAAWQLRAAAQPALHQQRVLRCRVRRVAAARAAQQRRSEQQTGACISALATQKACARKALLRCLPPPCSSSRHARTHPASAVSQRAALASTQENAKSGCSSGVCAVAVRASAASASTAAARRVRYMTAPARAACALTPSRPLCCDEGGREIDGHVRAPLLLPRRRGSR